jgi:single-strand DNA-binding protein
MASVNKVLLIGNLGKNPEVRFTPSGKACCRFPLATSEVWTTDSGKHERTEWHQDLRKNNFRIINNSDSLPT